MRGRLAAGLLALVAFLILLPALVPTFYVQLTTEILVMAIFSVATNLLFGYGGMISFGQAAYYGIGAYTLALLVMSVGVPFVVGFVAAPLCAALFAAVVGFFCVRLTIIYFAMLTLGFAQLLYSIVFQWVSVTGGDDGLHGVPIPALFHDATAYYYFTLAMTIVGLGLMWRVVHSPFGYAIRAIRDNRRVHDRGLLLWPGRRALRSGEQGGVPQPPVLVEVRRAALRDPPRRHPPVPRPRRRRRDLHPARADHLEVLARARGEERVLAHRDGVGDPAADLHAAARRHRAPGPPPGAMSRLGAP
ncbi:MAG: hypothetical protein DMD81_26415 [Candidatus Rokuibacteriota bacterium]|nr:MAG: hypothetical protein DMD81_26415 [Candidatus Rokubacteria bacterium]